ncbi:EamA family transporter [Agarivorans sp. B2Z047]|uniref:DMT family transporter n=1 Tax=Agarivorans sp. B2Z047 TaxID=2652721 RepID=UPI00128D1B6D|nr:EamA family transporter [Agarivorans sp. B2Z047]MPW29288.1 EamA family transporter [Agarivorans sp. B2Z047]UQN41840.1 EamA family transporter [Agarivorans sp. B2Z047]
MIGFIYFATVFIWGTTWLAIAYQIGDVPIVNSIMYRFALASLVLVLFLLITKRLQRLSLKQHGSCLLLGLCLFSCNFMLFYHAAQYIPSGLISIVFSIATIMNMGNSWLFHGQKPSLRLICGGILGISGIILLFYPDISHSETASQQLLGLVMALAGTYCFSLGNMLSAKQQKQGLSVLSVNAYGMAYGAALLLVWGLLSGQEFGFSTEPLYLGSLIYLAIIGSVLGFSFYLVLVGKLGPQKAAYATVLFPVVALGLSTVFEGYQWTLVSLSGVAIVLLGNLLVFTKASPWQKWRLKLAKVE